MEICVMSGKNIRSNCLFEREPFSFQLALSPVHENIIDPLLSVIFFHGDVIFVELRSENIASSRFGHCVRRLVTTHTTYGEGSRTYNTTNNISTPQKTKLFWIELCWDLGGLKYAISEHQNKSLQSHLCSEHKAS